MRRHLLLPCLSFAVATAPIAAQVAPSASAVGVDVSVGGVGGAPLAPGADVWAGLTRAANGSNGMAALAIEHELPAHEVDLRWQLEAHAVGSGVTTASAEIGYELWSPQPQVGQLVVTWAAGVHGAAQAALAIDLHGDGVVDLTGSAVVPVTFSSQPLLLRIRAEAVANAGSVQGPWGANWTWSGDASAALRVRFVPTHAVSTVLAPASCAAAPTVLARANLLQGVDLLVHGAAGVDGVLFALGLSPTAAALPFSAGCVLHVEPVVIAFAPVDASGAAVRSVPVPRAIRPVSFYAQAVGVRLQPLALSAGVGVRVDTY